MVTQQRPELGEHPHTSIRGHELENNDTVVAAARRVVEDLFGPVETRRFAVRYWDGSTDTVTRSPAFTLVVTRPGAFRRMLLPPSELSIVEGYLFGDIDLEGDLESAADLPDVAAKHVSSAGAASRLLRDVLALPKDEPPEAAKQAHIARRMFRFGREHSAHRDEEAVRFHYDVGNEFYALWLDRQMVYSCAYFERDVETLDEAQTAKLDLVCRKLRLKAGERLLDIGCGWGALVMHAARHYGVHATGITLSGEQASLARRRVVDNGLSDRVEIEVRDYRTLVDATFDKIASVGMVEHVGLAKLPEYFSVAYRVLKPGGLFLNHGIVSLEDARHRGVLDPVWRKLWKRDQFIRRYVFPDGDLVPSSAVISAAEGAGFELRDVESLREHYVATLRRWVNRLGENEAQARELVGDVTYRVWRLYMAASAHGFRVGRIGIIQSLLAKRDADGRASVPRTRADLYAD